MVLNAEEIERREACATAKLAVQVYSENPCELNFAHVRKAILCLRAERERALAARLSDHIWRIEDLVEAETAPEMPEPEDKRVGRFRVINGGLS